MPKKSQYFVLLALLFVPALLFAVQPQYSQAKLIQVERKTREKVNMYLVNTPVSTEVPYYEITVRSDQTDYKAEYTPRHAEEQLPEPWVEGADVMIRIEKHHLILKRPDGSELQWILLKRSPAKN
jgi:hypothetical protein